MHKLYLLCKTRNERLLMIAHMAMHGLTHVVFSVPFVLAYLAGVSVPVLVGTFLGYYGLVKGSRAALTTAIETMNKRMDQERAQALMSKLDELFQAKGQRGNVFDLPRPGDKKAGGIN